MLIQNFSLKTVKTFLVNHKIILLIFIFAFLLRALGARHAFPFITHPDEPSVVRSATGIMFDPNPGHFDWPHFYFYLNYILYFVFIKFRGLLQILNLRPAFEGAFPLLWRDPLIFYFLSRLFSSFLGALTVVPVYLSAKELFNKKSAYFAALVFSLIPFHIWHAHYALIDAPMVFWLSWALYFSTLILKSSHTKNYIFAGLFVGFSASTKYNGGLIAILVVLAHILRILNSNDEKLLHLKQIKNLIYSGVFSIAGFVFGTPYSVFDYSTFIRTDGPSGALWQFANVGKVDMLTQVKQMFINFGTKLSNDLGYTFLYAYFLFGITSFFKKEKEHLRKVIFLLIPSLFFFWYISGFIKTRSHYYMITYPFVAIATGYYINSFTVKVKSKIVTSLFLVVMFSVPLFFASKNVYRLVQPDTRNILYFWMQDNLNVSDLIIYDDNDFDPVLEKFSKNNTKKGLDEEYLLEKSGIIIVEEPLDTSQYAKGVLSIERQIEAGSKSGPNVVIYRFNYE